MTNAPPINILSIQSHVAFGHVGNSAAVFPMQRLGCEVWPIHTVQLSNHPGYGAFEGQAFGPELIDACMAGIAARGALSRCDALLSGFMGSPETGAAIARAVERVRLANPRALYCCDPVIGDSGKGVYVRPGLPEFISQRAVPAADILTPNQFELGQLAGFATPRLPELLKAVDLIRDRGPKIVLVTSVLTEETPSDAIDLVVADDAGAWRLRTPRIAGAFNGAGDAIAALFLVHWLRSRSAPEALARAASSVHGILRHTAATGEREIAIVAAQSEIASPTISFAPQAIR